MPFSLCKSMKCTLLSLCNLVPTRPSLEEEFAAFSLKKRFCINVCFFFFFFWHFSVAFPLLFKHIVLLSVTVLHRRLARLVVGPFWAWNCTGGGPSVHCKTTKSMKILQPLPGEGPGQARAIHCLQVRRDFSWRS